MAVGSATGRDRNAERIARMMARARVLVDAPDDAAQIAAVLMFELATTAFAAHVERFVALDGRPDDPCVN